MNNNKKSQSFQKQIENHSRSYTLSLRPFTYSRAFSVLAPVEVVCHFYGPTFIGSRMSCRSLLTQKFWASFPSSGLMAPPVSCHSCVSVVPGSPPCWGLCLVLPGAVAVVLRISDFQWLGIHSRQVFTILGLRLGCQ